MAAYGEPHTLITERRGDEERVARAALDAGADALMVLSGDGTWSRVGSVLAGARSECRLALAAAGTGNDLAKSTGSPAGDLDATAGLIWEGAYVAVDVMAVDGVYSLNVLGAGFDAEVLSKAEGARVLSGGALYVTTALRELFSYDGLTVEIEGIDSAPRRRLIVAMANGGRFGGAFRVAPAARMNDGLLDLVVVEDVSPLERLRMFGAVIRGTHIGRPGVAYRQTPAVTLRFAEPPVLDLDGEFRQAPAATVRVEIRPAALRMVSRRLPEPTQPPPAPPSASGGRSGAA